MLRMFNALSVWILLVIVVSCKSDGAADGAREWAKARTIQRGGEALRLSCQELRGVVQKEVIMSSGHQFIRR